MAVLGLGLTTLSAMLLERYDHRRIQERMQADAQSLEANIRGSLIRLVYASEISGQLLKNVDLEPKQQLQLLKNSLNSSYQSINHILYLDSQLRVRAHESILTEQWLPVTSYRANETQFARLTELATKPSLLPAQNLSDIASDLALFIPVIDDKQRYFIVLLVDTKELLKQTIHHHIVEGYQLEVFTEQQPIYSFAGDEQLRSQWLVEFDIRIADDYWRFHLWPTVLKFNQLHVVNSYVVPILGMFITGLLMLILFRVKQHEQQNLKLLQTNYQLKQQLQQRDHTEEHLAYLSEHDALTGLANRNALLRFLAGHLLELKNQNKQLVALHINVDHFKEINNTLGHSVGDELLRRLAHRLERCQSDFDFIARIGGDEFLVIKNNIATDEHATAMAEQIERTLQPQFFINNYEVYTSVSIGIAFANDAKYDADTLLRHADAALRTAKISDYHGIAIYNRARQQELSKRQYLVERIHKAIEDDRIEIHYQPVFDLRTKKISGLEALMRWRESDGELIMPEQFLPLIEDTGLIIPLTSNLFKSAFNDFRQWHQQGFKQLQLGINLSGKQLALPNLSELLHEQLRRCKIPADNIAIEIREEQYCNYANQADGILTRLRDLGIKLTVDGLGLNYATISAMNQFPPNLLKISQPLISHIPFDKVQTLIAETMIKFGQVQTIAISAVGVESQQQVDFLLQRDCISAQGYFLARPVPANQVLNLLQNQ